MRGWRKWPWRDIGAVALLIALTTLFYWRYLTPNEMDRVYFPQGDFTDHYYVYRTLVLRELRVGRFPQWIQCVFSGYPFQADPQSSLFYMPAMLNLFLFLAMGYGHLPLMALEVEAVAHVLLAALFTYAFLRTLVRRRLAALLGAIVFAFGGYLTSYPPGQIAILESAVWLPLALLGVLQLHRSGRWPYGLVTALAYAMSILAGNPQTYTQVIYTTLVFGVYLAWRDRVPRRTGLVRLAGPVALAAGLSAVQLLPSFEYTRLSTRAQIPFAESGTGFPLEDIVQFVLTGLVSRWQPLYVGILPLGLAILAIWAWRQRDTGFWLGLGVVSLALSFGANAVAFDVAFLGLPGYALFRSQERHAFLVSFALSVLAAYGADALFAPLPRRLRRWVSRWRWVMWASLPGALALLIAAVVMHRAGADPSDSQNLPRHVAALLLWLAGTAAILQARLDVPRRRLGVAGAALALIVLDLFTLNRPINYTERYELYPVTSVVQPILADQSWFRIQDDYRLQGHTACMLRLEEVWGIASIRLAHYQEFFNRAIEAVRWPLLGVRYLTTWRQELFPRPGAPAVPAELLYQEGEGAQATYLYRLPGELHWAWVARDLRYAPDDKKLYDELNASDFDPWFRAVLREPIRVPKVHAEDRIRVVTRQPNHLVLDVELGAPGLLLISEVFYPGWRATLDGQPTPIYEADAVLRSVLVPAGAHRIEMRYDPWSFKLGAAISVLSIAGFFALVVASWKTENGKGKGENGRGTMEDGE
ncbi:MAG: YfhO family protein [Anaerolineae bacterium]